jgi:outer membrane protein
MLSGFSSAAPTDYLEDPLRARPPLLDSGAVLPGDQQPFACPPPAFDRQALTLADAVDIALCANPQIKSAWAYIKVQAEALGEAKSAYLPTVTLGLSRIDDRTSYPGLSAPAVAMHGNADNVGLDWRLFDFGGREANRRMSTAMLDAAIGVPLFSMQ